MICPKCSYEMRLPVSLSFTPEKPLRQYECLRCGMTFETVEVLRDSAQRQAFQAAMFNVLKARKEGEADNLNHP